MSNRYGTRWPLKYVMSRGLNNQVADLYDDKDVVANKLGRRLLGALLNAACAILLLYGTEAAAQTLCAEKNSPHCVPPDPPCQKCSNVGVTPGNFERLVRRLERRDSAVRRLEATGNFGVGPGRRAHLEDQSGTLLVIRPLGEPID